MVLFDVIEPMECCLNPEYDYEPFHELMVLYKEKYEMLKSKQSIRLRKECSLESAPTMNREIDIDKAAT